MESKKNYTGSKIIRDLTYSLLAAGLGIVGFEIGEYQTGKEAVREAKDIVEELLINTKPKQIVHIGDVDNNGREDVIIRDYLGRDFILFGQKDGSYLSLEEAESKLGDCPSELEEFKERVGENILVKAILSEDLNKNKKK